MKPILAAGAAGLALGSFLFQSPEREPNDSYATATPLSETRIFLSDGLRGNGSVARGEITAGDVDHFSFHARSGELVTASLRDETGGELADAVLALFGPDDEDPLKIADDTSTNLAPSLTFEVDTPGLYTLAVTGFGDEEADGGDHAEHFAYRLAVAVAAEPPALAEGDDDRAPAERWWRADASLLASGRLVPRGAAVLTGTLAPGEVDEFLVPLPPRTTLTATVYDEADGEFNDSVLRLLDLRGEVLAADDDGGLGLLSRIVYASPSRRAPAMGLIAVEGFDPDPADDSPHEEAFTYRLAVSVEDRLSDAGSL
jgi:hypothetical protein